MDVAKGQARQASRAPNPVLGLEFENLGIDDPNGLSQQETTLSLSQSLELGGKRRARTAAGSADVRAAQARAAIAEAEFGFDLIVAYAGAEAAERRVKLLAEDLGRATEDARAARALVDAGKEPDLRAIQAQAAATAADAELQAAKADLGEALAKLSVMAGSSQTYTAVPVSLLDRADTLPMLATPDLSQAPIVAVAEAERAAASLRVDVERARGTPDMTVSVGARRFEGTDETGVVAGLSIPLPVFDANRGSISAATAQLKAASARLASARLEAETAQRLAGSQLAAGDARLRAAVQAAKAADEAYGLARLGYEGGKTPLIELLASRRAVTDAQGRLLDARLARIRAEAAIAKLAGRTAFGD